MKVLVTGVKGQLGYDVVNELEKRGHVAVGTDVDNMDITDANQVQTVIKEANPDAVIHCAAYTAVDLAEDNVDLCRRINADGTRNIAEVCKELDIKMIYISTDYVFDGEGTHFWQPDDARSPLNVYGQTKYEGELAVESLLEKYYIVRIAWVFGVNGKNFIKTMLNLGKTRDHLTVVNDQIGSPTYTYDLAKLLVDMVETDKYGRYHATNEGICSWYDFACEIVRLGGVDATVSPCTTAEYPTPAKRPAWSALENMALAATVGNDARPWQQALEAFFANWDGN